MINIVYVISCVIFALYPFIWIVAGMPGNPRNMAFIWLGLFAIAFVLGIRVEGTI